MTNVKGAATAAKFRKLADAMQGEIAHKFADRQTNTPKRQREAQSARLDGQRLERTQQALRALADAYDAGTVPSVLECVTSKADAFKLCRGVIKSSGGYYDAGYETGEPAETSPAAVALWALLKAPSEEQKKADELRRAMDKIQFSNIPGYFPTPAALVDRMIEAARIPAGGCSVLEPSAGSGAILDRLPVECAAPVVFERMNSLQAILKLKGYDIRGGDFLEAEGFTVARVLMNPPFESGQDIEHVTRAYTFLKPGGRLVAIMSPGPFFHSTKKALEFRHWFDRLAGEKIDIAAGTFKESGTGVASVMVVIDAPMIEKTDQGDQYVMPGAERTATQAAAGRGEFKTTKRSQLAADFGLFAADTLQDTMF